MANNDDADGAVTVLESQRPQPPAEADEAAEDDPPAPPPEVEAPPPAPAADAGEETPAATGSGPVLAACLEDGGGCVVINIAVLDPSASSCIELAVDNCGTYSRAGIPVDTPVTWRLGSASVGDLEDECVPAVYDPDSAIVIDGSGSIDWNLTTRRPSDLVLDISLEAASGGVVAAPIAVSGTFSGDVPDCDG